MQAVVPMNRKTLLARESRVHCPGFLLRLQSSLPSMTPSGAELPTTLLLETPENVGKFRLRLLNWYDRTHRKLPWRTSRPVAYRVWVSEIMLQQTRVAVVREYYRRFLRRFPTVKTLAAATEQEVLAAWSGLGYYRRARMLHAAAQRVVAEFGGKLPATSGGLFGLPGIGRYTAAAIGSIAFGEATAVVDGNVERVVERLLGQSGASQKPDYWKIAQGLLHAARPGDFNQAMMELGATVCLPRNPVCTSCPVARWCRTRGEVRVVRIKPRKAATLSYWLSRRTNKVALVQRPKEAGLMAGMWELPGKDDRSKLKSSPSTELLSLRHSITNTDYRVRVFAGVPSLDCFWIPINKLESLALTGLARKILQRTGILNIKRAVVSRRKSRRKI